MTWKQFWCKHIWKHDILESFLREERRRIAFWGYDAYRIYAVKCNCVKCEKTKIVEKEKLVI